MNNVNITGKTKLCMVIGDPIKHSLSPQMHNAGLKAIKLDNEFVFVASQVKVNNMEDFVKGVRAMGIVGVSLTLPHKAEIMQYLDSIDETAKKIGAVNTVVNSNGVLKGYNTDWLGIVRPLEKITTLENKEVALLGAGGAARAAAFAFSTKGASITIYNRTIEHAQDLAEDFNADARSLWDIVGVRDADVIFNATSVGMNSDETLVPKEFIEKKHIVFDAVYTPYETKLLKDAKAKGATVVAGMEMLLEQGVAQFELYTGHKAPVEKMRKELLKLLQHES